MANSFPLLCQPASFWLGAFLLAEAPVGAVALFLGLSTKSLIVDWPYSSALSIFYIGRRCYIWSVCRLAGSQIGFGGMSALTRRCSGSATSPTELFS